ncbi:hypothetical protein BpHYR1_038230 [Brachionus plicatilis]|uniref:Uncharacterized protein n=1 Tax=Brachionus plicatilis TaxID=10195 RepID=A0A3M7PCG6_BRAPC|nr:hypothetical protein BpHYR1_038230 [Brachionus plicatilis]
MELDIRYILIRTFSFFFHQSDDPWNRFLKINLNKEKINPRLILSRICKDCLISRFILILII